MTAEALLIMLVQLPLIHASGYWTKSNVCGTCHISHSSDSGNELFYVNDKLVDKDMFCKTLEFYHGNDCSLPADVRDDICGLEGSSDEFPLVTGRKFLHPLARKKYLYPVIRVSSVGHMLGKSSQASIDKEAGRSSLNPKMLAMAVPGFLILCSCLVCTCVHARKRGSADTAVDEYPSSTLDSVSPIEMNAASERVPASPRVPPSPSRFSMSPKLNRVGTIHLNYNQIARATDNFSPSLKIGEGGFGIVYMAKLEDGQIVAIKRAKKEHFDALRTEFSSEVQLLAKIDHRCLVKLLGYVDKGSERLIITEYVPNGTLRDHLDGARGKILDFSQRLEITIDIAHALTYLHLYSERQIIHRDVKSSNILITESLRPKVADFGFARLGDMESGKTHISTKVKGTVGYLDPEYMKTFKLTPKSDVYSFGVLLIEILTGRRPVDMKKPPNERITLRWAFMNYKDGNVASIMDPLMSQSVPDEILMKMFGLAIQCAAPTRADRPDMKTVGENLWAIRMDYLKSTRKGS